MDWQAPEVVWFVVGLVLILLEFALPGLITVFFGIGAWIVALICLFLPIPLNTQLFIFIILSVLSLAFLRKWFRNLIAKKNDAQVIDEDSQDEFIGHEAEVAEKITPGRHGRVEFRGSTWNAESGETINPGRIVIITGKKNITLVVKKK